MIGAISVEWERIRSLMPLVFATLLLGKRPGATQAEGIAMASLDEIDSFPKRCDLLRLAARRRLDPVLCKHFEDALGQLQQ